MTTGMDVLRIDSGVSGTWRRWGLLVIVAALWGGAPAGGGMLARLEARGQTTEASADSKVLLERIRSNLERERRQLLEYVYRERRRPLKVSSFGKVTVGEEQIFDVYPANDPDRPRRVLISVDGRPATPAERAEYARRHARPANPTPEERRERAEREAEGRRRAQQRLDDAFRVYRFELKGTELVDGVLARVVGVTPQPTVPTHSDFGKWFKKFRGTAWVDEQSAQLIRLEMTALDTISIGWGVVGRIAAGTTITYARREIADGMWFPARARFDGRGKTLLFRSFDVDTTTEWFDYRPYTPQVPASTAATR
jgi:hypothetical protein